jgi:hypothetical protein
MKGRSALATMFAFALLTPASMAWAQDEEEEESAEESAEEAGEEVEEGAEEAAEGAEEAVEEATEEGDAAAGGRWPRAVNARPLTLPKSLARLGAEINANNDFGVIGLTLNGGYGISDDLEVNLSYGLTLKEFEAKGTLGVNVGFNFLRGSVGGKLDAAARIGTGYDLVAEGLAPLVAGVDARYRINEKLSVIMPGTHLRVALEEIVIPPATDGLRPITFGLPIGVAYQATPELYVSLDTRLVDLEIADSATTVIFADTTPLRFQGIYNVQPNLDAFAAISTDLTNEPGDTLQFFVGANYYLGAL